MGQEVNWEKIGDLAEKKGSNLPSLPFFRVQLFSPVVKLNREVLMNLIFFMRLFTRSAITLKVEKGMIKFVYSYRGYPFSGSSPYVLCYFLTICRYGNVTVITTCSIRR